MVQLISDTPEVVPIEGFEGRYTIARDGRVFYVGPSKVHRTNTPKKISYDVDGYARVTLRTHEGKQVQKLLHVLLARAFISRPESAYMVDHKNGDKGDFNLSNLRWVTQTINQLNRFQVVAKSGAVGVDRIKGSKTKPWQARGKLHGKLLYLGTFATIDEAIQARKMWELQVGATTTLNTQGA